ncbi:hypothetical protein K1T71_012186 [Dendrolimus kikuchii]|uniref:Uncharacterized protein n=1 Tax=Dendrolimus kikuchii TaxID=765133 RepID=A0ACC1CL02_9NEOP|nr:hypothetical protein K1T71_012186 [Dendrolimus kikuchii]
MWSESDEDHEQQECKNLISRPNSVPKLLIMDGQIAPNIANLHVTKFSKVHIGDKYVTQNIYNKKTVNGQVLGPKPVSSIKLWRKRKNIYLVGAAIVATSSLILILFYFTSAKPSGRLDIGLSHKWYLPWGAWQALPGFGIGEHLQLPVKCVFVEHTAESYCKEKISCIRDVQLLQRSGLRRGWDDIGPNYIVGGNGLIFEGRGANIVGTMVKSYDHKCISVMFLGNYEHDPIIREQFDNLGILLKQLVMLKVLDPNYLITARCQVDDSTIFIIGNPYSYVIPDCPCNKLLCNSNLTSSADSFTKYYFTDTLS